MTFISYFIISHSGTLRRTIFLIANGIMHTRTLSITRPMYLFFFLKAIVQLTFHTTSETRTHAQAYETGSARNDVRYSTKEAKILSSFQDIFSSPFLPLSLFFFLPPPRASSPFDRSYWALGASLSFPAIILPALRPLFHT